MDKFDVIAIAIADYDCNQTDPWHCSAITIILTAGIGRTVF